MLETMTNTRKLAHIAILSTLSFLLMYLQFPLIPSASFLQFDFSILPVLVGLMMIDLQSRAWNFDFANTSKTHVK